MGDPFRNVPLRLLRSIRTKPPLSLTIWAWSRETIFVSKGRSFVRLLPMPKGVLCIAYRRGSPLASLMIRLAMVEPEILFDFLPYLAHCLYESKRYLREVFPSQISHRSRLRRRTPLVLGNSRDMTSVCMNRGVQAITCAGDRGICGVGDGESAFSEGAAVMIRTFSSEGKHVVPFSLEGPLHAGFSR